jgi:hypothetical protein
MKVKKRNSSRKLLLLAIFFTITFILLLFIVYAQTTSTVGAVAFGVQELKTVELDYGFADTVPANRNVSQILNWVIGENEGFNRTVSTLVRIVAEPSRAPIEYRVFVNGTACNPPSIVTSLSGTQYVADFRCENVITNPTTYNVTLFASHGLKNIHFRAFITYINNPRLNLTINLTTANLTVLLTNETIDAISTKSALLSSVFEQVRNHNLCIDNFTLQHNITVKIGNQPEFDLITRERCEFGCDLKNNVCNPPPTQQGFIFVLAIFGVISLVAFLWRVLG